MNEEVGENRELAELSRQVAAIRDEIHEVKEFLAGIATKLQCRNDYRFGKPNLFSGQETRIPLESAVALIWGDSVTEDPESLQAHTEFLKHWATIGLNAAVLEADIVDGKWYTSRESVARFQAKLKPPEDS